MPAVLFEKRGRIAYITLNRPEVLNAWNSELVEGLADALDNFRDDPEAWLAIITGKGDRAFSVGVDLKMSSDPDAWKEYLSVFKKRNPLTIGNEIWKPTIAAINGYALAGGCELALTCDIRVMAENTQIGLTEARVAMAANAGTHLLIRALPSAIAFEMLFTGRPLGSQEALRWGLANRLVPLADLMNATEGIAERILECAPLSVRRMKENAKKGLAMPLMAAFGLNAGPDVWSSEDRMEGASAFKEKRKPVWKGK